METKIAKATIERMWATGKTELGYIVTLTHKEQSALYHVLKLFDEVERLRKENEKLKEYKTTLEAWMSTFGTSQLTHAIDNMEALKKENEELRNAAKSASAEEKKNESIHDYIHKGDPNG